MPRFIVNNNGTSAQALEDAARRTMDKVHEAKLALKACAPNGRDYQVNSDSAGDRRADTEEFMAHMKNLMSLENYLVGIVFRARS